MIFVTEDLNAGTGIKVESPAPAADRVYVLKLNNVLKFTTGIYDYSVMTSVFSAVEPRTGRRAVRAVEGQHELAGVVRARVRGGARRRRFPARGSSTATSSATAASSGAWKRRRPSKARTTC